MKAYKEVYKASEDQQRIFRRRTAVYAYRYAQGYKKVEIANKLGVNKSTITRDIDFLVKENSTFFPLLEDYVEDVELQIESEFFKMHTTFDKSKEMKLWVSLAHQALEAYKEENEKVSF